MNKKIILFILFFSVISVFAENALSGLIKTKWTSNQGLVSDTVTDIIQDKFGFILIGTYDGLIKFDGVKFNLINKYTVPEFQSVSARILLEDKTGNLWIGTNGDGVVLMQKHTTTVFTIKDGLPDNSIRSICEDKNGGIWIGTTRGVCYIKDGKIEKPLSSVAFSNDELIEFIFCDNAGTMWVATPKPGLYNYSGDRFVKSTTISADFVYTVMFNDITGGYWLGTKESGLHYYSDGKTTIYNKNNGFNADKVNNIMRDNSGRLWVSTDSGVIIKEENTFTTYNEEDGLSNNLVEKIIEDRESNIWIATTRGGIEKLSKGKFKSFGLKEGLVHPTVNSVAQDNNERIWIGTDSGLSCFQDGKFIENQLTKYFEKVRIREIFVQKNNILLSTYSSKGFVIFDGNTISSYTIKNGLTGERTRTSLIDHNGIIWIGTTNGLNALSPDGTIKQYTRDHGLSNDYIMCIYEDENNILYVGTDGGGINIFNKERNKISYLKTENGLAGNVVFKIMKDKEGIMWINTGTGVSRYDGNKFVNYNVGSGLKSDSIFQLLEDNQGRFWMTSTKSVSYAKKFDMNSYAKNAIKKIDVIEYDKNDGLPGGLTSVARGMLDNKGNLWFPTLNGVAVIAPDNIATNIYPPLVKINSIKLDDKNTDLEKQITVNPHIKRIEFDYSGLSFTVPERVIFKYKLDGFDKDFSPASTSRSTTYTNLPPAKYVFKVMAANNDGIWSEDAESVVIIQKPYFYQRISFYIILIVLIVLLTFFIYSVRVKRLQLRQLELEKIVKIRTEDLSIEKEKSESLLLNILPVAIAKRLKAGETTIVDKFDSATILFADVVNFSHLAATTPPSTLLYYINSLFSEFDLLTEEYGIEKIKTIGDAYMAVAGVPEKIVNHAEKMMQFAFKMKEKIMEVNEKIGTNFQMRIGINTGSLVAGVIGTKKFIYDLWGDSVNVASRMEQFGTPGEIHVSEAVYLVLKERYTFEDRGEINIKSKGLMRTYFCSGENLVK